MFRSLWSRWFSRPRRSRSIGEATRSEFFSWFHLEPAGSAHGVEGGLWHAFRPSGPAFHEKVCIEIRTDQHGVITESLLGLDRAFIEGREGAFARDVAKSYLLWALPAPAAAEAAPLIANLSDLRNAGPVLMRGPSQPPPPDTSGLYAIFLGEHALGETRLAGMRTGMTNVPGPMPAANLFRAPAESVPVPWGWLKISVRHCE